MTAYQRDDGAEMVEYEPGRTIRRDHGIRLGLIAPEVSIGGARPRALAPAADPQPEPVAPPPIQPSHEDLVLPVGEHAGTAVEEIGDAREIRAVVPEVVGGFEGDCSATIHAETTLPGPVRVSKPAVDAQTPGKARPRRSAGQQTRLEERDGQREATPPDVASAPPAAPARAHAPRPAKRSLADILAEADRGHRALRAKVRP